MTLVVVVAAAISDLRTGKIFNYITYPAIVWGLGASLFRDDLPALAKMTVPVTSAAAGFAIGFLVFLLAYLMGWMGGGDVKLMAAVGALMGYPFILHAMFYSLFAGGVAALLVLIWRGQLLASLRDFGRLVRQSVVPGMPHVPLEALGGSLPFGVAISFGTMFALSLAHLGLPSL